MKNVILALLLSTISLAAQARSMRCSTEHAVDMSITVEPMPNDKEKLSVNLTNSEGENPRAYFNSNLAAGTINKSYNSVVTISKSDLKDRSGGAYLDAGIIHFSHYTDTADFKVTLAIENVVHEASCNWND